MFIFINLVSLAINYSSVTADCALALGVKLFEEGPAGGEDAEKVVVG